MSLEMIQYDAYSTHNMKSRGIGKQWNCRRSCFVVCISQENWRISAIRHPCDDSVDANIFDGAQCAPVSRWLEITGPHMAPAGVT